MKKLWIAAVAAGWAWAAQAGMGIVWSTCGWCVEAGGDANAGPGVAENNTVTWQLVYAGANNAPDAIDPSAAGWTGGDDVLLAERVVPAGGGTAADGTSWDSFLMQQGGNTTYEDLTWPADRDGFVFQRVFQGAPAVGTPYAESGLFAFDPAFAGNGAPPNLFYFPADGYGLVLDRTVPPAVPPVPYLDPTDAANPGKVCTDYAPYAGETPLTSGWWVVTGNITNNTRIVVSGDVHLILADGGRLTAPRGITVEEGNRLSVFAQSDGPGMGALFAGTTDGTNQTCYGQCAGIGGNGGAGGEITIGGGTVAAIGGQWGAGIGGGKHSAGGKVSIVGGTVNANGGSDGAGIGGGWQGAGGDVAICGGAVVAQGGYDGFGVSAGADPLENEPPTVDCGKFENATVLVNYHQYKEENDSGRYLNYASARRVSEEAAGYVYTLAGKLHFPVPQDISDNGTDPTRVKVEVRIGNDVIANDAALQQYKFRVDDEEEEATHVIHFTFTDEAGNVTECHQTIVVMKHFRPVPDCPDGETLLASNPIDGSASCRYTETPKARMDYWKHEKEKVGTGAGPADLAAYNALHGTVSHEQTEIYPYKLVSVAGNVETLITENNSTPEIVETRYLKEAGPAGTASWWNSNNNPDRVNKVFKRDFTSADKAAIEAAFSNLSIGVHAYRWYFRNNENREAFCDFVVTVTAAGTEGQAIGHGGGATDPGPLSIDGMKAYESQAKMDADEPVAAALRESVCRGDWAGLEVCFPHSCTAYRNNGDTHTLVCAYCGTPGDVTEAHDYGADGLLCPCGARRHVVTVTGGSTTNSPAVAGTTVTVTADAPDPGMAFAQWAGDDGVAFADPDAAETTFTMPATNVTVTAVFAEILIGGLDDGGYPWTGKAVEPDVAVSLKGMGLALQRDRDYAVSYSNNVNSGTATATVTMLHPRLGSRTATFTILPPPEVTDVTAAPTGGSWNGQVDIAFNVTKSPTAACPDWNTPFLSIVATDNLTGSNYVSAASALSGDTDAADGPHSVTWDMDAQGIDLASSNVTFTVAYLRMPDYCVIDLSGGTNATNYAVSYLDAVPEGGWTDLYKTTKFAMRLLAPGTFTMGASSEEGDRNQPHSVTLTQPFYCAVFETTQKQWELVAGNNPSSFKGDTRPVEKVSYDNIRGAEEGAKWPKTNSVDSASFLGVLRKKTGLAALDLPTEAQWEYACRAGTTTAYGYGDTVDEDYMWFGRLGADETHTVGTKLPNAWGLYDMHGNVFEWCLDRWGALGGASVTNPVGSSSGVCRVRRGGSWHDVAGGCTSSYRYIAKMVHTLGDSTMADYDEEKTQRRGWGMYFGNFLADGWESSNHALDGCDARRGYNVLWKNAESAVEAGDYVLIQFAHVDGRYNGIDNLELQQYYADNGDNHSAAAVKKDGRGTTPSTTYKACLTDIINAVKAKGATPVLVSAVCRCHFTNGALPITKAGQHNLADRYDALVNGMLRTNLTTDDHSMDYSYQMKQLATEQGVAFIDMTAATKSLYESYGTFANCYAALFDKGEDNDTIHYNTTGALAAARLCAKLMKEQNILADVIEIPTDLPITPSAADVGDGLSVNYLGFRLVRTLSDNLEGEPGAGTVCAGASAPVAVGMRDFADTDIKLTPYDAPYDGQPHTIVVETNAIAGLVLRYAGRDASTTPPGGCFVETSLPEYVNVTNAIVFVEASAPGYYTATNSAAVKISPRDIGGATVAPIPVQYYEGAALEPVPTVTDGTPSIIATADYAVSYTANDAPGTATVTLTGMGNYTNQASATFQILPAPRALAVTAGKWGTVSVETNGVACAAVGPDATANLVVGYGAEVSATAAPNAGFAVDGDADPVSIASYTASTNLVFAFRPDPTDAAIRWKFSSAVGRYFAQVAIPSHAGYAEALDGLSFLFADRTNRVGDVYAQLWNAAARAPEGELVTDNGVAYRGVALDTAAFAGLAEGTNALWGVSDETLADTRNVVPSGERPIGLYVRKRVSPVSGNETAAEVENFLGYLTWTVDGARWFLPVVEGAANGSATTAVRRAAAAAPAPAPGRFAVSRRTYAPAALGLAATLGLGAETVAAEPPKARIAEFEVGADGSVAGRVEAAAGGEASSSFGATATVRILSSGSLAGPWREEASAEADPATGAFALPPGGVDPDARFFKAVIETRELYE